MLESLLDAVLDSLKLIPFLLLTYIVMEYIENRMGDKAKEGIRKAGAAGPLAGGLLGVIPQCGFSAAASNLYAGRIITLGTLFSVYLSTSDEMLPIFISEEVPVAAMIQILSIKCLVGIVAGFLIDFVLRILQRPLHEEMMDHHLCEHTHCHCERGIFRSALVHTLQILFFIFVISFILNMVIAAVGEKTLQNIIGNRPVMGSFLAGLIGLIPNCSSSVVITKLYLEQVIGMGPMFSGLLVNAGVGLIVLFRVNEHIKENCKIVLRLYAIGVFCGIGIQILCQNAGIVIYPGRG